MSYPKIHSRLPGFKVKLPLVSCEAADISNGLAMSIMNEVMTEGTRGDETTSVSCSCTAGHCQPGLHHILLQVGTTLLGPVIQLSIFSWLNSDLKHS